MSFPVPGDAIEQSLALNQHLIHNPAATFFMRVEGDMAAGQDVQPGDLLVVDRSQTAQDDSLVVAAMALWAGLRPSQVIGSAFSQYCF